MKLLFVVNVINCLYCLSQSNEYFLDTCCSLDENQRIYLSCGLNEIIRLNLIEIFYNSDEYCSSELYCCKYRTQCSRRITKYSILQCDHQNSCWIDRSCLKISKSCANIYGLYGQYITINYSCLPLTIVNESYSLDQSLPFVLKLLTSQNSIQTNSFIKSNIFSFNQWKSSPIFLIFISFTFTLLILCTYCLANRIGKQICRKKSKTNRLAPQKLLIKHENDHKIQVLANNSLPRTRIYPTKSIYQYDQPYYKSKSRYISYSCTPHRQYLNVEHDPISGQISTRTFQNSFNYY